VTPALAPAIALGTAELPAIGEPAVPSIGWTLCASPLVHAHSAAQAAYKKQVRSVRGIAATLGTGPRGDPFEIATSIHIAGPRPIRRQVIIG
jgi:hypothetical protein